MAERYLSVYRKLIKPRRATAADNEAADIAQ